MKISTVLWSGVLAALAVTAVRAHEESLTSAALEQRAAAIRPTPQELRWQQIPWLATLAAARDTARAEGRPIFVWTLDEDPFDRC